MMFPILYSHDASPPCRAVLLTAKAIGIALEEKTVNFAEGDQLKEEYLKINPQHTIPSLIIDDGLTLTDSHVIMAYLVSKYAVNDDLYPLHDLKRKSIIDQRLHFDSGVLFARGLAIFKPIVQKETKEIPEKFRDALKEAHGFLEKILEGNDYVAGNELSIADFSLATSVTSWEILVPVEDKFVNIKKWLAKIEKLPYYNINQKGLNDFRAVIEKRLSS